MKRILSSVGIGSATVDLVLPSENVVQGETVDAEVDVVGGEASQEVDEVYYAILTRYSGGGGTKEAVVSEGKLTDSFTIEADEHRTIDVDLDIPEYTPVSMGETSVWIETGLDIDWAVDPDDHDDVSVQPSERTQAFLDAMEEMGFGFQSASNVADERGLTDPVFVQEFAFRPRTEAFASRLDDVEVSLAPGGGETLLEIEVDRRSDARSERLDEDESTTRFSYDHADVDVLTEELEERIERHADV